MTLDELFTALTQLNRVEKLRAMQVLVESLTAEEETGLVPGATYELLTPYTLGTDTAAQVLLDVLAESEKDE